ncbi:MAG: ABC transporter permease [Anaerolineae bacterium]|nr:ABC transporter permease [Anaerolineae bacterium]
MAATVEPVISLRARRPSALGSRLQSARDFARRLWKSPSARLGGFIVLVCFTIAFAVPIVDSDYQALGSSNLRARYAEPDCVVRFVEGVVYDSETKPRIPWSEVACNYPMGADKNGRGIFDRVGHGFAVTLRTSVLAVSIALSIGSVIGMVAGYLSGWVDSVAMRSMDIILAFPALLLAIAIVTIRGPGLTNGMIAVAITQIPIYARLSRSMAISIRNTEYVTAARSLGTHSRAVIWRHVVPNSLAPLIVQATLGLGTAVIETAALGFLGLGQQPPNPELGKMLAEGQQGLLSGKWWMMAFPGAAIIMIVLGFNLLGDGLRDVLDPRLKK